jgi:hypothetical protein
LQRHGGQCSKQTRYPFGGLDISPFLSSPFRQREVLQRQSGCQKE